MMPPPIPAFRFATEAQWASCLFVGADREGPEARAGMRPPAPFAVTARHFASDGAFAPALADAGEILWRDDAGRIERLPYGAEAPRSMAASAAAASATRLVAARDRLWARGAGGALHLFDADGLALLLEVELDGYQALDIAADGHDGLYALAAAADTRLLHIDPHGHVRSSLTLDALPDASALAYLARSKHVVLLAGDRQIAFVDPATGEVRRQVPVAAIQRCLRHLVLGSDGCDRIVVAGVDRAAVGRRSRALVLDADGEPIAAVAFDGEPTGAALGRRQIYVTTAAGLLRFDRAEGVPSGGGAVTCRLLTPTLESPAQGPQCWLRVEAEATLPAGSAMEVSVGASDDPALRGTIDRLLSDERRPARRRMAEWQESVEGIRTVTFGGTDDGPQPLRLALPLHAVRARYLWVEVGLIASPGGGIPQLSKLAVLYPGPTLIEKLPAIYQRGTPEIGDFVRGFVGVLEASTQDLDQRIADMGRSILPDTAPALWLDYVARWLGLPWDDAIPEAAKRRILANGAALARGYGTRAGLETLLDALMPERPRRWRVVDVTVDLGIARIGSGTCPGSALPALLTGLPDRATELGVKAILGKARLPCGDEPCVGATGRFLGRIWIDLAVDAAEAKAWAPWLEALVTAMLPATARLTLRWLPRGAFAAHSALTEEAVLRDAPLAWLGADAVIGAAQLGGRGRPPPRIESYRGSPEREG